jgi:hypothetical protein
MAIRMQLTPQDIIHKFIEDLVRIQPGDGDFKDVVFHLVASTVASFGSENLDIKLRLLTDAFGAQMPIIGGISGVDHIEIGHRIFGEGGPLHGVRYAYSRPVDSSSQFIAAMYYLHHSGSELLDYRRNSSINKQVTGIAFEGGENWRSLQSELLLMDTLKPNIKLLSGIPDQLEKMHLRFWKEKDLVFIQKAGGVERLKEVGASLKRITKLGLMNVHKTQLDHVELPLLIEFLKSSNSELIATGIITREESKERCSMMMVGVMNLLRVQKSPVNEVCHALLLDLAPSLSKAWASDLIPRLSQYLTLKELSQHVKVSPDCIGMQKFKKALNKHTEIEHRYDLLIALGLDSLFKPSDIQKLKVAKLESALGL